MRLVGIGLVEERRTAEFLRPCSRLRSLNRVYPELSRRGAAGRASLGLDATIMFWINLKRPFDELRTGLGRLEADVVSVYPECRATRGVSKGT